MKSSSVAAILVVVAGCVLVISAVVGIEANEPLRAELIYLGAAFAGGGPIALYWLAGLHDQALLRQLADLKARDADTVAKAMADLHGTTAQLRTVLQDDSRTALAALQRRYEDQLAEQLAAIRDALERVQEHAGKRS